MIRYAVYQKELTGTIICQVIDRYQDSEGFCGQLQPENETDTIIITDEIKFNRAIIGDIVEYDPKSESIINLISINQKLILGIVQANSRVTYGSNKQGKPYYLVKTINPNQPNFLVPYDRKKNGLKNQYVIIKRFQWTANQKRPIGIIHEYLGFPGTINIDIQAILARYDLPRKNINPRKIKNDPLPNVKWKENNDFEDCIIFSIDPEGCQDIDDAMHFKQITDPKNNKEVTNLKIIYEVGIHIAAPNCFIPKESQHQKMIQNRLTSIYTPESRIDMIEEKLAIDQISLKTGQSKKAHSIIMTFDQNGKLLSKPKIQESQIKMSHNYSYQEVDQIIKPNLESTIQKSNCPPNPIEMMFQNLFHLTQKVAQQYLPKYQVTINDQEKHDNQEIDSHQLIEIWMLMANWQIGEYLVEKFGDQAPIRVFEKNNTKINPNQNPNITQNQELQNLLRIRNQTAAVYRCHSSDQSNQHQELGLTNYTHFTSPIRRYFDLMVHRMIFENDYQEPELETRLKEINDHMKRNKAAERYFNLLKIVYDSEQWENNSINQEKMILVDFDQSNLELWSSRWKIIIKYRLIPRLLTPRFEINSLGQLIIKPSETEKEEILHQFELFQEIDMRSIRNHTTENFREKIVFEMLLPEINLLDF